jgi:predicted phosphodiesterase
MHCPYEDKKTMRAVLQYAADERWDVVVIMGDMLDMDAVSFWDRDKPRISAHKRLKDNYDAGNELLDRIVAAVRKRNRAAKIYYLEGNHEFWIQRELDKSPFLEGLVEVPVQLRLRERGIKWVGYQRDSQRILKIGKAQFMHGRVTNKYHANKNVSEYGTIIYAHTHDVQEIPLVFKGRDRTWMGKSIGCLCDYEMRYMQGRPQKWQQAICVLRIFPDGYFDEQTAKIFKHRFHGPTNGKLYDGR